MNERIARIARQKKGREQKRKMEGTNDGERERGRKERSASWFFSRSALRGVKWGDEIVERKTISTKGGGLVWAMADNEDKKHKGGRREKIKSFLYREITLSSVKRHLLCPNLHESEGVEGVGGVVYAPLPRSWGRGKENAQEQKWREVWLCFLGWRGCRIKFCNPRIETHASSTQIFTLHHFSPFFPFLPRPFFSASLDPFSFVLHPVFVSNLPYRSG